MANETFKIEIPIEVNDMTSGGTERATKTLDAFGKAVERAEAQLDRLSGKNLTIGDMEQINSAITAFDRLGPLMNTSRDSFNELRETISSCAETMSQLNSESISTETMEKYVSANNEAKEALEALERAYRETEAASENYVRVIENEKSTLDEIKEAASRVKNAEAELASAENRATEATQELSEATEKAEKESSQWENTTVSAVNAISSALAAAGIVKFFKEIATAIMECETLSEEYGVSLAKLSTIADTSSVDLGSLKSEITDLSSEIGKSVNDLSEASYQAISAGIDTANAVSFTETATKLAVGGFTEATTAVDVLTTAINAYGKSVEDADDIANMLVTTQNLGKTTVDQLAQSVGRVIPVAAAYNVEMDNLMSAYAELTKGGIATAEATTYLKGMLNELGDSGSTVSGVLQEETGKTFAQLSEAGYSLGDVLQVLGDSVDNDATKFNELWSSQEAGVGALSLLNAGSEEYNETLKAMQSSAGATEAAFSKMDDTVADAKEDMINAANNLKIAVGDNLSGAFEGFYNGGTKVLTLLTNLAEEHPILTRAVLTFAGIMGGAAAAFAVAAAAEAVYTAATTVATTVTTALGVAINVALGPFALITAAISGVVAAVTYFSGKAKEAREVTDKLTSSSQKQADELEDLKTQYEELKEAGQANTEEAYALEMQIDELTASFESNKKTVGECVSEAEALKSAVEDITTAYDDAISAAGKNEYASTSMATQLFALSGKATHTASELETMQSIVDALNGSYSGLGLTLDTTNGKLNFSAAEIYNYIKGEADEEKKKAATDALTAATGEYGEARKEYVEAIHNATEARYNFKDIDENYNSNHFGGMITSELTFGLLGGKKNDTEWNEAQAKMEELEGAEDTARDAVNDLETQIRQSGETLGWTNDQIEEYIQTLKNSADAENEAADGTDNLTYKVEDFTAGIDAAAAAYKTYYSDLKESFEGQYSLFDKAKADADATIASAQAALNSQLAFWTNYADNVSVLKNQSATDLGITQTQYDELMAYAQSGTEEAAGFAASLAQAVQSGNTETIQNLANTMTQVKAAQDNAAAETADWKANLTGELEQFGSDMQDLVDSLDKGSEAYAAAQNIMEQYTAALLAGRQSALDTANETVSQITSILNSASVGGTSVPAVEHADGGIMTRPHMGIVAEAGPEAIIPLSASKSDRGLDLWLEAGRYLGAIPYAEGGIVGDEGETETGGGIPIITANPDGSVNISLTISPSVTVEKGKGSDDDNNESIAELINEKCKEAGEDIIQQLATMLKQIFSNMPVKGSA